MKSLNFSKCKLVFRMNKRFIFPLFLYVYNLIENVYMIKNRAIFFLISISLIFLSFIFHLFHLETKNIQKFII
jgi:hypothetical protein